MSVKCIFLWLGELKSGFTYLAEVMVKWRSWLRHCATNRKIAGSIPYGVTGTFNWHNPSGRTMALEVGA
jgi:hypothetical protein